MKLLKLKTIGDWRWSDRTNSVFSLETAYLKVSLLFPLPILLITIQTPLMATPPHPNLDFFSILSSTKKVTKAINKSGSRHFQLLSVLFILPFSLLLIAFPHLLRNPHLPLKPIIFTLLYSLTLLTLYLCAISTITYSLYHGFFGRRLNFLHSIKSMFTSLFKLFLTFFCVLIVILFSLLCIGLIVFGVINIIQYLGFVINIQKIGCIVVEILGLLGSLYLCVNWVLAPVIVVVESSWGLEPLRRSAYLVKGMRGVVVCLMLYFGALIWFAMFGSWYDTSRGSGMSVLTIVCASLLLMFFLPNSLTANTILYMNCKALHGELAAEIVEEFDREYVTLPFGEEKVPHLASIV